MMRLTRFVIVALVAAPSGGAAQLIGTCRIEVQNADRFERVTYRNFVRQYAGGNVRARCLGQTTRMHADSAAYYEDLNRMDFVGSVRFEDSSVTLEARRANYFLGDDRLEAFGDVRLVNLVTGSVLTGQNLTYWRAIEGIRDTAELLASQRPTIAYRSVQDTAGAEPYIIIGNRVRLRGDDEAWAAGSVTIDRSDFHANGDSTELDMGAGRGTLVGHAYVEGAPGADSAAAFTIEGRVVNFTFTDNDLEWIQSQGLADATSAEWRIVADTMEFSFARDLVQGGIAWGDSIRAQATSKLNTIVADSLAIDSPDQILTQIRAFGTARTTSVRDSVDLGADWVAGDTVIADFDSTATGERFLSGLNAGGNARALYRVFDPELPEADPDINYSRGLAIRAEFSAFGVQRVDVVGLADGVHLEPAARIRRPSP